MESKHIKGENKGKLMLYALSTCQWCMKTKKLLEKLNVEFDYIDVDLVRGEGQRDILMEIKKHNPSASFPTLVINDNDTIIGFDEEKIKEKLK